MRLAHPFCLLSSVAGAVRGWSYVGAPLDGHDYREIEIVKHCTVTVLKCRRCDKYEILWDRAAAPPTQPHHCDRYVDPGCQTCWPDGGMREQPEGDNEGEGHGP